jgi:CubicO group peptidase (beta-lactamase class C family)
MLHHGVVVRLFFATALLKVAIAASTSTQYAKEVSSALNFVTKLSESRIIGGTVAVQKAGQLVWSKGFGYASEVCTIPEA